MKTTKSHGHTDGAKAERRARRHAKHGRRHGDDWDLRPLGGPMDPVAIRRTIDAFSAVDLAGSWEQIAPMVLPLLKRIAQPYPPEAAPIHLRVPPGVWAGFGIDVGPAWAHVSRTLVDRWQVDEATLLGAALDNLRRRAIDEPPRVEGLRVDDARVTVVQAQGWGSALILAPDRLEAIIGTEPQILLTPVRNALVALPADVELELAVAIWATFAENSGDELDVDPLCWTGSAVVAYPEDGEALVIH